MPSSGPAIDAQPALGQYLSDLRAAKDLSLRDVEEMSDKTISNAHLSQIEKGKVKKVSPHVLHALSEIYSTSYEDLMRRAGYVTSDQRTPADRRQTGIATYAIGDLSREEHSAVLTYLKVMRKHAGGKRN